MTLKIPNDGEVQFLENALRATTPEALILHLYSNDYDPTDTSVVGDLTEVSASGYAPKTLTRAGWNAPVAGAPTVATYGTVQAFAFTASSNVVGYYLVGATSGKLWWAERMYAGSGQAFGDGDECRVTPRITFSTLA